MTKLFKILVEREVCGRWIADVIGLPGVMAYGNTRDKAILQAQSIAFMVLCEKYGVFDESTINFTIVEENES
jgi:predicted RNase H-like HicB family nuclease